MRQLLLVVVAVLSAAALCGRAGAAAALPPCPGSIGGYKLDGPTNVGAPGVWLQGDGVQSAEVSCNYPSPGQEYEIYVSWITAANPGHEFDGCGSKPSDPATTFVSGRFEAYAGMNVASGPGDLKTQAQALLAYVEGHGAKPCATATPAAAKVSDLPEYAAFLGLNDPTTAVAKCSADRSRRDDDLVARAGSFAGVTGKAAIPGERATGVHSPVLIWPGDDLFNLLGPSDPPSELRSAGNVYAKVTGAYEQALRAAIAGSEGGLEPADVLYYALKVTGGSYPLAVLTAHNLLKEVAIEGRTAISRPAGPKQLAKVQAELSDAAAVVSKLASLRCNPRQSRDKIGLWYHEFAVLSAGALLTPAAAPAVVGFEHGGKGVTTLLTKVRAALPNSAGKLLDRLPGNFFKGEGGFDSEKFASDQAAAGAAMGLTLRRLSRNVY